MGAPHNRSNRSKGNSQREVGLADLRQRASEIVRDVESGEEFLVTVSGRAAARLSPIEMQAWVPSHELALLFAELPAWGGRDRLELAEDVRDPWQTP